MLTPEQTEELRTRLTTQRRQLVDSVTSAIGFSMDRDRDRVGRDSLDESTEEAMYSTQLRLHDRETFLLNKIDAALERLKAGTIDECEECGGEISVQRLIARPVTTLCIDCKSEREQSEEGRTRPTDL
ncbi:TraR/DksA family transcriptional regulator [Haliangium ochraceum]|uniref:Transcriptional regulator, TraR/DksA family n=1 Tax=Haliangium ochraceum (strain DSM 14365 / JCM 11303 / SMP-2) TaxID=502025 RepID=D0LUD2_HALO1|nr:TraR/DksA C4-type zinc finger protein [Haliangium ochraceum]ACY19255.1 transcriptional regulator, TraR/DksA family [Haliangium ochraceum DSM 14365]